MKTITWHGVLQAMATLAQVLNAVLAVVPANDKVYVGLAIGVLQVILHQYATTQWPPNTPAPPPVTPPVQ